MSINQILMIAAIVCFAVEVVRSQAKNFVAWGLLLWALALVVK